MGPSVSERIEYIRYCSSRQKMDGGLPDHLIEAVHEGCFGDFGGRPCVHAQVATLRGLGGLMRDLGGGSRW